MRNTIYISYALALDWEEEEEEEEESNLAKLIPKSNQS
jgi:hypothetical protein